MCLPQVKKIKNENRLGKNNSIETKKEKKFYFSFLEGSENKPEHIYVVIKFRVRQKTL